MVSDLLAQLAHPGGAMSISGIQKEKNQLNTFGD